jgi:hypothetical protein
MDTYQEDKMSPLAKYNLTNIIFALGLFFWLYMSSEGIGEVVKFSIWVFMGISWLYVFQKADKNKVLTNAVPAINEYLYDGTVILVLIFTGHWFYSIVYGMHSVALEILRRR